jgi:hypothetical protein
MENNLKDKDKGSAFEEAGEVDVEAGAFAGFGLDVEAAVGFFEEALDDGQAEAGAFARGFGGEVGLE